MFFTHPNRYFSNGKLFNSEMNKTPLVSIITAVLNAEDTIGDTIRSVLAQTYNNIEYIIIDGGSADRTLEIILKYKNKIAKVVREPDKGIYEAFNKGLRLATGDIVGFINADDIYADNTVLQKVVDIFMAQDIDSCYGDLVYVDKSDINRIVRYWSTSNYKYEKLKYGWMPPHPTCFIKREIYEKYGNFRTDFKIAADYELMLRLFGRYRISTYYIPRVIVKMRTGGISNKNLRNLLIKSFEDYRAWKVNRFQGGFFTVALKNISKLPQFLRRRRERDEYERTKYIF